MNDNLFSIEIENPKTMTQLFSALKTSVTELVMTVMSSNKKVKSKSESKEKKESEKKENESEKKENESKEGKEGKEKKDKFGTVEFCGFGGHSTFYVTILLKESEFTEFYCSKECVTVGINLLTLWSLTKGMDKSQTMKMSVSNNSDYLNIICKTNVGSDTTSFGLTDYYEKPFIGKYKFDAVVTLSTKWFKDVLLTFSQAISGTGSIELILTKKQISFSCLTETDNMRTTTAIFNTNIEDADNIIVLNNPEKLKDNTIIKNQFALDNLQMISKFKDLSYVLELYIGESKPLAIILKILGESIITLIIAPCGKDKKTDV